jgi:hypothetical protein
MPGNKWCDWSGDDMYCAPGASIGPADFRVQGEFLVNPSSDPHPPLNATLAWNTDFYSEFLPDNHQHTTVSVQQWESNYHYKITWEKLED